MATRELGTLEVVPVTEIWPHEERNFTKWMAEDLSHLEKVVGMELELVGREYRTEDRGRVDILATDKKTGRRVVIENQIYSSDNDHFLRMISYAASTEAKSIIWVASHFHDGHVKMLRWLTEAGVDVFGVTIGAVKIGDAYAPLFEAVVSPEQAADRADASSDNGPNFYGRFYRPLTAELRTEGINAIGGRQGGWTGRFRRFRSGTHLEDAGITYFSAVQFSGRQCSVGLLFNEREQPSIFDSLRERYIESENPFGDMEIHWEKGEMSSYLTAYGPSIPDESEEGLEVIRKWMKDTLLSLRSTLEPELENIILNSMQSSTDLREEQIG